MAIQVSELIEKLQNSINTLSQMDQTKYVEFSINDEDNGWLVDFDLTFKNHSYHDEAITFKMEYCLED